MPFDGSEFIATPVRSDPDKPPSRGPLRLLWQIGETLRSRSRTLPFVLPIDEPTPSSDATTIQVLGLARSLIQDERHWIQRRYETLDGRRCAVGAVRAAVRLLGLRMGPIDPHHALLMVAVARGFTDIEKMNDHSSHAQIVSAFDEAIYRLRAA
ncbi:MAG TPA: hypothetical protein VGG99_19450 [Acetobacteraceae bacterium]|jgi:hypothetical protein